MPTTCVAIGCTSGYRTNFDKCHFFKVPKDPELAAMWQISCKRTDIILTNKHSFCHNHFTDNDIVWKKTFCDKNGIIIQEIQLKKPYLKKGAVPSIFSWTKLSPNKNKKNKDEFCKFEKNKHVIYLKDHVYTRIPDTTSSEEMKLYNIKYNGSDSSPDPDIHLVSKNCDTLNKFTFNQVKEEHINIPSSWRRWILQFNTEEKIYFNKIISTIEENKVVSEKEIFLFPNFQFKVYIMGCPLDMTLHGYDELKIKSTKHVEQLIRFIDDFKVCKACKVDRESIFPSVAIRDSKNILRHRKCLLIVKESDMCIYCCSLHKLLEKRQIRSHDMESRLRRYYVNDLLELSPNKKKIFQNLREAKNKAIKKANRQKIIVKILKKKINELTNKIQKCDY